MIAIGLVSDRLSSCCSPSNVTAIKQWPRQALVITNASKLLNIHMQQTLLTNYYQATTSFLHLFCPCVIFCYYAFWIFTILHPRLKHSCVTSVRKASICPSSCTVRVMQCNTLTEINVLFYTKHVFLKTDCTGIDLQTHKTYYKNIQN